jgi:hypothetical protein
VQAKNLRAVLHAVPAENRLPAVHPSNFF